MKKIIFAVLFLASPLAFASAEKFEVIQFPKVEGSFVSKFSDLSGLCTRLGYTNGYVPASVRYSKGGLRINDGYYQSGIIFRFGAKIKGTVILDEMGQVADRLSKQRSKYITSISCYL